MNEGSLRWRAPQPPWQALPATLLCAARSNLLQTFHWFLHCLTFVQQMSQINLSALSQVIQFNDKKCSLGSLGMAAITQLDNSFKVVQQIFMLYWQNEAFAPFLTKSMLCYRKPNNYQFDLNQNNKWCLRCGSSQTVLRLAWTRRLPLWRAGSGRRTWKASSLLSPLQEAMLRSNTPQNLKTYWHNHHYH